MNNGRWMCGYIDEYDDHDKLLKAGEESDVFISE